MNNPREQFGLIYDQYIEKIYRFVYVKVNSQEVAEDITSKVFLKGWEAFQNGREPILNPSAFLYQIARNAVVDHYREKGKAKMVSPDNVPQVPDSEVNIHEKALVNSDIEAIKASIQNLKKEYQDVLIWHYLEDMPIAQIAEILDKPPGTVRVMLHRGLNSLRDEFQES
ncbi:MAG: sigma-70 family RNA polymerase sigma factor [bacterium]|nr:sigma-70 family RNA polymerase sigma factor [bacterium]